MNKEILDDVVMNENDPLNVKWAGFWTRVGASIVDIIVYIPFIGITMYSMFFLKSFAIYLAATLLMMVYKPFMEYMYGATFGKMAMKVKVVNTDFNGIDLGQAVIRYIPWMISQFSSIFVTYLLFQHEDFMDVEGFLEISQLQQETTPMLSSFASVVVLISVVVVAFNSKKQGLHDMMAKTYCIHK